MSKIQEKEILKKIIDDKYDELGLSNKDTSKLFWKIVEFEANAIGQIGEKFTKIFLEKLGIQILKGEKDENIHDEYDIKLLNNITLEIKTARLGSKNNTFQFNGINPQYNYDFLICIGISEEEAYYRIVNKKESFVYEHDKKIRGNYIEIESKKRKLVSMNPNNQVNLKLTLNKKDMKGISLFEYELMEILNLDSKNKE